ncbi:MAG: DNA-3-methyladenine glycosylase 2 family protein [Acidobacteria bacterium]|nr:DNA-3-methyladenine glycosylase 2 family protein [Acidobacteriota bacterium]MBI3655317.1 DNA-3-methyladenine glycosylase 2 family protein [Acidobacteriota bacterium]
MLLPIDHGRAAQELALADRPLGRMIDRIGPFKLEIQSTRSPFESLVRAIVYQQLTGKAAATILDRVKALYESRAFPKPKQILDTPPEVLRGAGLSRAKTAALLDLAGKTLSGTVPSLTKIKRMTDDEIVLCLTSIRGVGVWTAEMLLIFGLGRPDVLPIHDYGLRKGFARTFKKKELPTPKEVASRGERWRPYRTVASWYLWRASELPHDNRRPPSGA